MVQSADDALLAIRRKLHTYRGESRFTTWAYKFALYEAAARPAGAPGATANCRWTPTCPPGRCMNRSRRRSCCRRSRRASRRSRPTSARCSSRSRCNGVPIDVLAERLDSTRGALYKTLHDARRALRAYLADHDETIARAHEAYVTARTGPGEPELGLDDELPFVTQLDVYVDELVALAGVLRRSTNAFPVMRAAAASGAPPAIEDLAQPGWRSSCARALRRGDHVARRGLGAAMPRSIASTR